MTLYSNILLSKQGIAKLAIMTPVRYFVMWFFALTDRVWAVLRAPAKALIGQKRLSWLLDQLGLRRLKNKYWRLKAKLPDGNLLVYRPQDQCVIEEIYVQRIYGDDRMYLPGQIVVDLGGHIGIFTLYAAKKVGPEGRVIVCEPGSENLVLLRENLALNRYPQISLHPLAIAEREGEADFFMAQDGIDNPVADTLWESPGRRRIRVPLQTLDNILDMENIRRIDHLKIDIEGAELLALHGGKRSLKMTRRIIMEIHPTKVDPQTVSTHLKQSGFQLKILSHTPLIVEALRCGT